MDNPWINKGLRKSSKRATKALCKVLKNRTAQNEEKYKTYKTLFKKLYKKKIETL